MLVVYSAAKGNGREQNSRLVVAGQKLIYIRIIRGTRSLDQNSRKIN